MRRIILKLIDALDAWWCRTHHRLSPYPLDGKMRCYRCAREHDVKGWRES